MKYYAKLGFVKSKSSTTSYILASKVGEVKGLKLGVYKDTAANQAKGVVGSEYIRFSVPREPSIRKYFAHTFESADGDVLTSTEALDDNNRTFGDTKRIGSKDLILIEFSADMETLMMYFIKNKGTDRWTKQNAFRDWVNGEQLVAR